ncbi:type IV secretory system conjugative DNA transfer family protein [Amycolatopsis sp. NBC_01480]|uniref:type IV secretory system conjugative DNA transfer family protein n=1 Tax=Amycolatopsis sp. NBC_01480 TaxID=2903562 RepID=UPI002E29AE09|nr:type IV secretory system conjugative DNA transfer family protein [Amycolatopsis sp. NBC_01480]
MILFAVLLCGCAVLFVVVLGAQAWEADRWSRSLVRYRLGLPRNLTARDVAAWLSQIGAHTVPPRFSLLQTWPVAVEIEASSKGITHTVLVPEGRHAAVLASLRASLPGVRVDVLPGDEPAAVYQAGVELRLTSHTAPLGDDRAVTAANGALAALQPLPSGSAVRVQWLFAGVRASKSVGTGTDALRLFAGATPDDHNLLRDQRQKQRAPLLVATGRIAASGPSKAHAFGVIHRIVGALRVLEAPGAHFLWRIVPSWLVRQRIATRQVPLLAWPLTFNALEAVGAAMFPLDGVALPGLRSGTSRRIPPSPDLPRTGVVIGETNYPGITQPLAIRPRDRTMHTYVLGPTGTGKSTLLANMALSEINAGYGGIVVDPKSDLITSILERFPEHRLKDLIVLDPSDLNYPTGFNPLAIGGGEHERELAAETIAHVLKDIFRENWGPRTDDILRAALLSLVRIPAPNGEPFAMTEIPELLTNVGLRHYVANHPKQHDRWRDYWREYDQRSEAEQLNMVGPVLNKLRAFTHRTSLRLILGQARGVDLNEIFTKGKIVLVPLSDGLIGTEAASLVGSLLVGSVWRAALRRTAVPSEQRRKTFGVFDEFQNIVRMSNDVTDMLGMARALNFGLTLAHQYAKQVPEAVRAAVLGTARTQIFFQTEYEDAQLVAKRVAPVLIADDLMGLGAYEMAARLCVDGQTRPPVTGRTLPLSAAIRDAVALRRNLAGIHGVARAEVEAGLLARAHATRGTRPIRLGEIPTNGGIV